MWEKNHEDQDTDTKNVHKAQEDTRKRGID